MKRIIYLIVGALLTGWLLTGLSGKDSGETYQQRADRVSARNQEKVMETALLAARMQREDKPSGKLTLVNSTSEQILVRIVDNLIMITPSKHLYWECLLRAQYRETVSIPEGKYYLKARYSEPGSYSYEKSEKFFITTDSVTIITLEKSAFGNFRTTEISGSEF